MEKYLLSLISTTTLFLLPIIVSAQTYSPSNRTPQADTSQIGTQVKNLGSNNFKIEGGLLRGQYLFHSFTDFSVPTNGSANFINPTGRELIITRVTGNLFSDLNGLVNTNGANFLLINPNGIVFGANAQLNVGKAFVTSTANGINLVDGAGRAIVFGTNPSSDTPLLTINPNVAFNISNLTMGTSRGNISNFGTLQTNNASQYIGLIGGNVNLTGGKIIAPGGRVDIGGLNTPGTVSINSDGLGFNGTNLVRGDVSIVNGSSISVRANQSLNPVNPIFFPAAISPGSSINISANRIDLIDSGSRFLGGTDNPINQALGGLDAGLDVNSGIKTGTIGNISLDATGDIKIQKSAIFNLVRTGSQGIGGSIKISGNNITVTNKSEVSTNLSENAIGRGGDINITAEGNFNLSEPNYPDVLKPGGNAQSVIAASTYGRGNSGKVKIAAKGNILISDNNTIASTVQSSGTGDSAGIEIEGASFILRNGSQILTFADENTSGNKGNAGNIAITTTGDITISGSKDPSILTTRNRSPITRIASTTLREGNAGKITLTTPGKLSIINRAAVWSQIRINGVGNGGDITINAGELLVSNRSDLSSNSGASNERNTRGNAGNINIIATGNVTLDEDRKLEKFEDNNFSPSNISSSLGSGIGNGGKITIKTPGKVSVGNRNAITSTVESGAQGNGGEIIIDAGEFILFNQAQILTVAARSKQTGNAGNINIKTKGNITIAGNLNLNVKSDLNEPDFFFTKIASDSFRDGDVGKITIEAGGNISLLNRGGIRTKRELESIGTSSGDIIIKGKQLILDRGDISVNSTDKGGDIKINTQDLILMRRNSSISTNSTRGGDGGNITINSTFILANNENNDITANAVKGEGGNVNINAQGVFGIQFRSQPNPNSSDITVSSEFGRSGNVQINTPGIDPGKEKGKLNEAPNDASNQISQACGASQRDSKFYITGRGGLPPTATEPLESPALWEDARAAKIKLVTAEQPLPKFPLPAIGLVLEQNGRARLVAAQSASGVTGTRVGCRGI